jgi:hypothetical protein
MRINEVIQPTKITSADILSSQISSEAKVRMLEELYLTGSPSLLESIEQSTIDKLNDLKNEFSGKLVIGKQYIPVYIMGFDNKLNIHDTEGNSPAVATACMLTLINIKKDELTFKDTQSNKIFKYPDDIVGKNTYAVVIATDSVNQYEKLCIWLKMRHSITMPPAKKDMNEVIHHPRIKTKNADTSGLVNRGKPVPPGKEQKLLGNLVGKLGAYQVYKWDDGRDSAYSVYDPRTRISQMTISGHNRAHSFEIFGIYGGPASPVRAADLYAWLVKNQGLTLVSDKYQSPGGQRVWQELEQRYGRSVNVYAYNMRTNEPINTGADDPESTHGHRGDVAQNVRLVAAPK